METGVRMALDALLDEWCAEYGIDRQRVTLAGYAPLDGRTMGLCTTTYIQGRYESVIRLDPALRAWGASLRVRGVLWHEFAHVIDHHMDEDVTDGIGSGHGEGFRSRRRLKPILLLGDILAKLTFILIRASS